MYIMATTHNLNIEQYSFTEILELFSIPSIYVTEKDMYNAKRKLMDVHPDKSDLPTEYFHFYKQAFDVIKKTYDDQQRCYRTISANTVYEPVESFPNPEKIANDLFNQRFEKITKKDEQPSNEWFTDPNYVWNPNNQQNIVAVKQKTRPVNTLSSIGGANLYDNGVGADGYHTSGIFSNGKLKYDDLRRVYNDRVELNTGLNIDGFVEKKISSAMEEYKSCLQGYDPIHNGGAKLASREQAYQLRQKNKEFKQNLKHDKTQQMIMRIGN